MLTVTTVSFRYKDKLITWFISNEFIYMSSFIISFLVTAGIVIIVHKKRKKLKTNGITKIKSGGADLSQCFQPDVIYEVVDTDLKEIIFNMLEISKNTIGRTIIDTRVAILAAVTVQKQISIANFFSISFPAMKLLAPSVPMMVAYGAVGSSSAVIGVVLGIKLLALGFSGIVSILGTLAAAGLIFSTAIPPAQKMIMDQYICQQYLRPVFQEEVAQLDGSYALTQFIDPISELPKGNIYVRDSEYTKHFIDPEIAELVGFDLEFHTLKKSHNACEQMPVLPKQRNGIRHIQESCNTDKKFLPLSQRTKTIQDLQHGNHGKALSNAKRALDSYESYSSNYAQRRTADYYRKKRESIRITSGHKVGSGQSKSKIDELLQDPEF